MKDEAITSFIIFLVVSAAMLLSLRMWPDDAIPYVAFSMAVACMISIAILLGLNYVRLKKVIARKEWEKTRFFLLSLGFQCILAYVSILCLTFFEMSFWMRIALLIVNTFSMVNTIGEYSVCEERIPPLLALGLMMYFLFMFIFAKVSLA